MITMIHVLSAVVILSLAAGQAGHAKRIQNLEEQTNALRDKIKSLESYVDMLARANREMAIREEMRCTYDE